MCSKVERVPHNRVAVECVCLVRRHLRQEMAIAHDGEVVPRPQLLCDPSCGDGTVVDASDVVAAPKHLKLAEHPIDRVAHHADRPVHRPGVRWLPVARRLVPPLPSAPHD